MASPSGRPALRTTRTASLPLAASVTHCASRREPAFPSSRTGTGRAVIAKGLPVSWAQTRSSSGSSAGPTTATSSGAPGRGWRVWRSLSERSATAARAAVRASPRAASVGVGSSSETSSTAACRTGSKRSSPPTRASRPSRRTSSSTASYERCSSSARASLLQPGTTHGSAYGTSSAPGSVLGWRVKRRSGSSPSCRRTSPTSPATQTRCGNATWNWSSIIRCTSVTACVPRPSAVGRTCRPGVGTCTCSSGSVSTGPG